VSFKPRGAANVDIDLPFVQVDSFPAVDDVDPGALLSLSLSNRTNEVTHGLHRFPAKFIPQVPGWAMDQYGADDVLDPFSGSGTTAVEALLRGRSSTGLDVDPLARFIAAAKATPVDPARLDALRREITRRWVPRAVRPLPMSGVAQPEHWFSDVARAALGALLEAITGLDCSPEERRFCLVVFSSVLRWVSNADDQTQKTYVSHTRVKSPPPVAETFWRAWDRARTGMADLVAKSPGGVATFPADGNAVLIDMPDASVGLAATSPPYLDSVDYPYNMMLEYFWLGPLLGVPDRCAYNELRRVHVGAKRPGCEARLPAPLEQVVDLEALPDARRKAAATYFARMDAHLHEMARVLRPDGRYVVVVGNSQTLTSMIPLHEALTRLAAGAGLDLEHYFAYRIRRHYMKFPRAGRGGIILMDWVLTLRRASSAVRRDTRLPQAWLRPDPRAVAH
jgi:SAM-dependent methyltransferase